jgi:tetratricopeptide (TPR) repeat protein
MAEAGISNAGMARAIVLAGRDQGVHLATTTTSVSRMVGGTQPRWPVPRLVAEVLTKRLGYAVTVATCGFTDQNPTGDTFDGFKFSPTVDGTMATVVELSGRDLNRRNFMIGSAFAAASFAEPAWFALTASPPGDLSRASGSRIGASDVEVLVDTVRHFENQQRKHGGGRIREQIIQFLNSQTRMAREASFTDHTGEALYSGIAQTAFLAGLTSIDTGRHALGQQYFTQALTLAMHTGDRIFAANILAEMSRETIDIGQRTPEPSDSGQHAASLARSALQVSGGSATPRVAAYLHAIEARGLSLLGDRAGATDALNNAQRAFDRGDADEPGWVSHYGEADLISDVGQCLRDIGRPQQGLALLTRAADLLPAHRVTAKAKTQIHIAAAHLELGDYDQADKTTANALTDISALSSARTLDRVRALQHRARRHRPTRVLRTIDDRITEFLGPDA